MIEVSEMSCASCSAKVEGIAQATEGVEQAKVNLLTESLTLSYDDRLDLPGLLAKLEQGGYPAKLPQKRVSLTFGVEGMSCASCAAKIEQGLAQVPGVEKASVNLATEKVSLRIHPDQVQTRTLKEKVEQLGYALKELEAGNAADLEHSAQKQREKEDLRFRFFASSALTLPLFLLAMGPMLGLGLPDFISPQGSPLAYALVQLALCLPVMLVGHRFYSRGFRALLHRAPNMDSLIALGTLASFGNSLWGLSLIAQGHQHGLHQLYFESTAVILTLILMGKWLEAGSKQKSVEAMKALLKLKATTARLLDGKGRVTLIPIHEVLPGDRLLVQIGERVPIDGKLLVGETAVDQSFLTGESLPVEKKPGEDLIGASLNQGQPVEMEATKTAEDSALSQIIRMVEEANAVKAPVAALADKISGVFVPVVMGIALLAGLMWYFLGSDPAFAVQAFVAVMVIACPCALGLATPTAIMVGVGRAASLGILIKGGDALEALATVDRIVFDKTGTLTQGQPQVADLKALKGHGEAEVLALMAGAEARSEHVLAKAILAAAQKAQVKPQELEEVKMVKSLGVEGRFGGQRVLVGHYGFLGAQGITEPEPEAAQGLHQTGQTVIYLAVGAEIWALAGISDPVKPEAQALIEGLKGLRIKPLMLTGDHAQVAQGVAQGLGIGDFRAGLLPGDKLTYIKELQNKGEIVAMVGDGINDAPALMQAQVGIAIGKGADVAIESADFILVKDNLLGLLDALALSRLVMKKIKQNLFWAFGYNILGIPFAAGLLVVFGGPALSPMIAALAMALSSVSVLTNSLTLRSFKGR